jgi:D-amino-acid dehydrogenase
MTRRFLVLGAGMVGVSCALALQRRGFDVTLVDRRAPGEETSYGNAGVVTRSSLSPFNQPALWKALPRLLRNCAPQLRFSPAYVLREWRWCLRFLAHARQSSFQNTSTALDALIRLSMQEHEFLLAAAGAGAHRRTNGWMFLYRQEGESSSAASRALFQQFDIQHELLDRQTLHSMEPAISEKIRQALWIKDSWSVDDPSAVVNAYAQYFTQSGGRIVRDEVLQLVPEAESLWRPHLRSGLALQSAQVVIALGPWSPALLAPLGMHVPMAFERGYHMHFAPGQGPQLQRPVYDSVGGYVLSPMRQGLRLTTGVELNARDAPAQDNTQATSQLGSAEHAAREVLYFGERVEPSAWLGRRPTLPDSRPMIGPAPKHPGLWLACGHQHIGFNTGPGSAALLAAQICGEVEPIDGRPFRPSRYL